MRIMFVAYYPFSYGVFACLGEFKMFQVIRMSSGCSFGAGFVSLRKPFEACK